MTLGAEPFAPLSADEVEQAVAPKKGKTDKIPIVPVPDDAPPCEFKIPGRGGAPKTMWAYRDEEGRLLGYDARFEHVEDGETKKDVLPVTFCQLDGKQGWRSKALPSPRPLYGLDRLAARPDAPVVIAEGCKSADAAGALLPSHVAMSWQGGGNAVAHSNWRALKARDVLIWPDRDRHHVLGGDEKPYDEQVGYITAQNIAIRLNGVAASVRLLDLEEWDCKDGWDAADALDEGWTSEQAASFIAARSAEIDTDAPGTVLPFGFEYGHDGLYHLEGDKRTRVAGRIKVLAKTRDVSGSSWGLLLEWRDHDGRQHRWAMPMSMLAGDGSHVREGLLDRGLFVPNDAKPRGKLMEFLGTVDTAHRARATAQCGWTGPAFALPELTIGDTPEDRVIFQANDAGAHHYQSAGTLEEWQEHVGKLALGNNRLVFMIACALVGPALLPASREGGGVNIVGSSSTGKTTGMRAAASFWGPPAFIRQWRATSNGLESVAAQHNETFLCLDELSQIEPREAGPSAYMLANGQGKSRATRTGGSRAAATWKVMYLSTGEVGLAGLMAESKVSRQPNAGQEVRILDLPADAGKGMGLFENIHGAASPAAFSRQIATAAGRYYGTPAIAYLTELALIRDDIGAMIGETIDDFTRDNVKSGSDGQVVRGAERFGLIAAAGELGIALGVLPWPTGEAIQAAGAMFRAWVARRGGIGSSEERNILAQVRGFLEAHGDSRFEPVERDEHHRIVINRAGFWKPVLAGDAEYLREYWVLPETFKNEMCKGFDHATVVAALTEAKALKRSSEGKSMDTRRLPEIGPKKVYVIGTEIFDGD